MFMHDFNSQLTADRMHGFETEATQHRLRAHTHAAEVKHTRTHIPHRLLAIGAAAGAVVILVTQTAPRMSF